MAPRPLKPYKVDSVRHPNGGHVDVFFDRDKKLFFVSAGMERVEHTDLTTVKQMAKPLLVSAPVYEWRGVIVVTGSEDRGSGPYEERWRETYLGFRFSRLEVADDPGKNTAVGAKGWMRPHQLDFEEQLREQTLHWRQEPAHVIARNRAAAELLRKENRGLKHWYVREEEEERVLPYEQPVWDGLVALRATLETLREELDLAIAGEEFEERLRTLAHVAPVLFQPPARKRKAK